MKTYLLTLVAFIVISTTSAQQNFLLTSGNSFDNTGNLIAYEKETAKRAQNNIATERRFRLNSKGDQVLISETKYEKNGNWIEKSFYNKQGQVKNTWKGTCNDAGKYIESKREKPNGKVSNYSERTFDANNNLTTFTYKKNGKKIQNQGSFTYDQNNLCIETIYSGSNPDKFRKFVYTYYEDGKNKETVQYDCKGKEKHRWSYSCDPKGNEVTKKETDVCEKTEIDESGNRTVVYEYDDEKQKIGKVILVFDKNDNKLSMTRYRRSGKTYSNEINTYDAASNLLSKAYYKNGDDKAVHMMRYEYDVNNNRIKSDQLKRDLSISKSYKTEYSTF